MTDNDPCPTGSTSSEREARCPFRADIARLTVRLNHIDDELRAIKSSVLGNGRPGIEERARIHADERANEIESTLRELDDRVSSKFEKLKDAISNMRTVVAVLAAGGAAGGSAVVNYLLGAL